MDLNKVAGALGDPKYAAGLVSVLLVGAGIYLLSTLKNDSPLKPYVLQILGLLFILPVVMLMAVILNLGNEAVTSILGTIVGYIFGTARVQQASSEEAQIIYQAQIPKSEPTKPETTPDTGDKQ